MRDRCVTALATLARIRAQTEQVGCAVFFDSFSSSAAPVRSQYDEISRFQRHEVTKTDKEKKRANVKFVCAENNNNYQAGETSFGGDMCAGVSNGDFRLNVSLVGCECTKK